MAGSGTAHLRPADQTLLRIEGLVVEFPVGRTGLKVNAVSNVSIDVLPGETLGLVGESGCGKSTMGKAVMQLVHAKSGSVLFEGSELTSLHGDRLRALRPKLQMIFQDPISSLNPRRRVRDIVREGLDIWKIGDKESRTKRVNEVLDTVGIDPTVAGPKRPHEFSGGQCQRISIARAVATEPKLIICDEPVSALDVSVQAQILNLLEDMKRTYGLTLIFIAHDLAVVKNVSDRVAVMYLGKLCEFAQPDELYARPAHPYTAALLSAIPEPDPSAEIAVREGVGGEIPSPVSPPSGCRFRTRCPNAEDRCASEEPLMREVQPAHFVACHFPLIGGTAPAASAPDSAASPVEVGTATTATTAAAAGSVAPVAAPAPAVPEPARPLPPVTPVAPTLPAPSAPIPSPPPLAPPTIDPPGAGAVAGGAALGAAAGAVAAGDDTPTREPAATDRGWVAPSPVSPTAPPLDDAPVAPEREPDDAWLRNSAAPPATDTPRPAVDWTPATEPEPPAVVPPPAAPVTAPVASAAAPPPPPVALAPDEHLDPQEPRPESGTIPDVASLDTLLPDRSKGGSINPER